jgi:ribosomal protein S4E
MKTLKEKFSEVCLQYIDIGDRVFATEGKHKFHSGIVESIKANPQIYYSEYTIKQDDGNRFTETWHLILGIERATEQEIEEIRKFNES